ncbi:MAG: rRNA maturation RNase YbeY [Chloroflexi bacterium]|nr:rRNA maturation RNase YbeY [Chloroflexota bacterium]
MESVPYPTTVDVQVFPPFARRVTKTWLRSVAQKALQFDNSPTPLSISLVIADDDTVRDLNRRYRGYDETTDVLAFPLQEIGEDGHHGADDFPVIPSETSELGEIVVSYPQAARQAREGKKPIRSELALLVVHGILHLLGYDHAETEEERVMWAKQDEILATVSLT